MELITPWGSKLLFRGVHFISIDVKGRIAIPTRYRDQLLQLSSGNLVITVCPDRCLYIFPTPQWDEFQRKLEELPNMKAPSLRKLQRFFIGHASDCELDAQGRVLIPTPLREFAGLDKSGVLLGQGKKFELWDEARWNEISASLVADGGIPIDDELKAELDGIAL